MRRSGGKGNGCIKKKSSPVSVFVSRNSAGAFFNDLQQAGEIVLECRSCIRFEVFSNPVLPVADWIFFSSPTSVEIFAERYSLPDPMRIACIGTGTGAKISDLLARLPDFEPADPFPKRGVREFGLLLQAESQAYGRDPKVLCIGAAGGFKRLNGVVPAHSLIDLELYRTIAAPPDAPSRAAYLVFTSPSNARAYLSMHSLAHAQWVVAIGESTAEAVRALVSSDVLISGAPTEKAIWDVIQSNRNKPT